MPCNVFELLASLVVANFQNVDFIVAFDAAAGRLFAISITDVIRKNFDNLIPIKRVAEIQNLGSIKFVGMKDFMSQNPNSCIENYIEARLSKDDVICLIKGKSKYNKSFLDKCLKYKLGRLNTFSNVFDFYDNDDKHWDKYSIRELYNLYILN